MTKSWLDDYHESPKVVEDLSRNFYSDTATYPTPEMFDVMKAKSSHGDDVYGGDEATRLLEQYMAQLSGKEDAMFAMSGTMTNQLGIRAQLHQPPYSIIVDSRAHVYRLEAGGLVSHSGALPIPISASNGHHLTLEDIIPELVLEDDLHTCTTKMVSLENTLSGMIFPQDEIIRISKYVRERGIILHCDGARLWEVAAETGQSIKELCDPFDSVSLCVSKGVGAPIGSVLVGTKAMIEKARWFRKMFGGGVRQSGMLAVAAQYAIDNYVPKLPQTHQYARELAEHANGLGARILLPVETNMVFMDLTTIGAPQEVITERGKQLGLRLSPWNRYVIHHQITREGLDAFKKLISDLANEYRDHRVQFTNEQRQSSDEYALGTYTSPIGSRRLGVY